MSKYPDVSFFKGVIDTKVGTYIYSRLKHIHTTVRYYKTIPKKYLKYLRTTIQNLTNREFDSCVINGVPIFNYPVTASIIMLDHTVKFKRKKDQKIVSEKCPSGTVILFGKKFEKYWKYTPPKHLVVTFFNECKTCLPDIYLHKNKRQMLQNIITDGLSRVRKQPLGQQCIGNYIKLGKLLGTGDFGNVYESTINDLQFAIKFSRLSNDAINKPYSYDNTSWFEVLIMKNIFKPLIIHNICPNLPLLYDSFVCNDCKLTIRDKTKNQPCVITITEFANGTFRDYLKKGNPSEKELYSALFQIMVAIHCIQLTGQIMNYDVKADNILYYNVKPGGYWTYIIHKKRFYVPNYGKLFILNDFGISRPMSPMFQLYRNDKEKTFRMGSRLAMVIKNKFVPIECKYEPTHNGKSSKTSYIKWNGTKKVQGGQYRLYRDTQKIIDNCTKLTKKQLSFLKKNNLPTNPLEINFFEIPEIIPPFEFYNDLQDAIRMFIGGKRTTQRGDHRRYPVVTDKMYNSLSKYNGKGESMSSLRFSTDPTQVLAGYFIESFFTTEYVYTVIPKNQGCIDTYNIS